MEISQKLYSSLLIHIMLKDNFQETELENWKQHNYNHQHSHI